MELKTVAMEAMPKASLEEMLAIIPQHNLSMLDQKVNDANLMKIASALVKWRTVCTDLRITEAEEEAITQENPGVDAQRYVGLKVLMTPRVTCGWSVIAIRHVTLATSLHNSSLVDSSKEADESCV